MTAREQPIRVLLVGPSLAILGGQAIQARRLLERLAKIPGLEVSFLPVNPTLPGPLRWLQRIKYVRTIVTSIVYVATLVPAVLRNDVIHAFSAGYWSFLLAPAPAIVVGRLLGRKVVLNYRTGEADDHLTRHRLAAIPLMRLAHVIAVPSGFLIEVFARHGLEARAIANFVDTVRLPFRDRSQPAPRFLSNRNLEPLYNVACVLRAFGTIQGAYPDASLVVAGQGREEARLKTLATDMGLRQVSFVGAVAPEQMGALYDAADIYLNSPDIDNMPTSIIEAFACGLPVVTTDAGGIPFIVRHEGNGLMVPRNNDAAMAASVLRLLREPGLASRLTASARADVLARYTWESVADQWADLYHGLMAPEATAA
jgi:glycosyltransferase involved in cell wall biosynthesis